MIDVTCYIRRLATGILTLCVLVIVLATLLIPPSTAQADDYIPLAPIKADGTSIEFTRCNPNLYTPDPSDPQKKKMVETPIGELCLPKYLTTIYNMGIALAGLFLVFAIVRGGFTLMFTDSVLGKLEGKKIILQAMGGAVIVFSSYLLMNTINPQLAQDLNLSLKFPRVVIQKFESILKPVFVYEQELDKTLADLNAENAKPNIVDAKAAKGKALDAAEDIRGINDTINELSKDLTGNKDRIDTLIKKRGEIDAARIQLLSKAADADLVAAKARINLHKVNALNQLTSTKAALSDAIIQAVLAITSTMETAARTDVFEMQRIGFPQKADEIWTVFQTAMKEIREKVR